MIRIFAAIMLSLTLCASCSRQSKHDGVSSKKATAHSAYIIMEKVLADQPGRPRTTMKIMIPKEVVRGDVASTLEKALSDLRHDDPTLKAVMIWAYRSRAELNGSNFTAGKLEWSADNKDFAGQVPLSPNPKINSAAP